MTTSILPRSIILKKPTNVTRFILDSFLMGFNYVVIHKLISTQTKNETPSRVNIISALTTLNISYLQNCIISSYSYLAYLGSQFYLRDIKCGKYKIYLNKNSIACMDTITHETKTIVGNAKIPGRQNGVDCPFDIIVDFSTKTLYIMDTLNHCIKTLDLFTGVLSTFMGCPGQSGQTIASSTPSNVKFTFPLGMELSPDNLTLYVHDYNTIYSIDIKSKVISILYNCHDEHLCIIRIRLSPNGKHMYVYDITGIFVICFKCETLSYVRFKKCLIDYIIPPDTKTCLCNEFIKDSRTLRNNQSTKCFILSQVSKYTKYYNFKL
jgi:hypothetical protein